MPDFLNTFQNGMHQDNNPYYQPEGTYRFAKNLQLVNHDGNNVTLKDTLGNRVIILLDIPFASSVPVNQQSDPMPIGFISFPDRLIVLHTNSESASGGGGEIGQIFLTNIGESVDAEDKIILTQTFSGYVPLYYHESLDFSKMYKIEGFGFSENDETNRIYWTDNFNEPRVFNLTNPIFTDYKTTGGASANPMVVGQQYMVIAGIVQHNAIDYGKGLATGNVFTAVNQNYTIISANALVIPYFPFELLAWTPSRALGNMTFNSYGTGSLYCGSKMYFYRIGRLSEGYFTSWSYGNYPIHVGVQNSILSGNAYHDFVGDGSTTTLINSSKSIKLDITNIDTNFDTIQLACAEYDQSYTVPRQITIVRQETITGASMTLEHFGTENLGTLTLSDVTLFPASILKCKTITTNKNYNIIANITERSELDFDKSTVTITSFEYPMIVHGDDQACANGYIYENTLLTAQLTANPAAGAIRPFSRWLVTVGNLTTDTVVYNATNYIAGDVITGIVGQTTITFTGSGAVRPCVSLNKYRTTAGIDKPNAHQIRTGFWDYKDPLVASFCRGYWSHEKYRIGILFYDKKGNPFYARHLGDYTMPLISTKGGLLRSDSYSGTNSWSLNPSLLKISGIRISQELADQISGFSIVRAERDVRIVTQGLAIQNELTTGATNIVTPSDYIINYTAIAANIYSWICPDGLVSFTEKESIGVVGDKMEEAAWLAGLTFTGGVYYRAGNGINDAFTKQFTASPDASSGTNLRIATILGWQNISEGNTVTNVFSIPNYDYNNYNITNSTVSNVIDQSCAGGGTVGLNGFKCVGGKKFIIYMNGVPHFGQYPAGYDYTASGVTNDKKILMNYVKELANPYGGNGEQALASTLYMSTGHFQPINASVLADTLTPSGYYEFNNVEVAGGDCFTVLADYGYGLRDDVTYANSFSIGYYFPCECNTNYNLRRGRKISNNAMGSGGIASTTGVSWNPTRLEEFSYNQGYSSEGAQFLYPALPVNFLNTGKFSTRSRFAGKKIIGEIIDSFRVFLTNDYTDVDVQLGEINNLKAKGDYVYYWQNHGVGSMPILERQMISASAGAATELGTGGVLTRFDTISTKYGNQHQWGLTDTEYGWIWFDMRNKDVCVMGFGGSVQEITVPTGMKSYFSEVFLERLTTIFNGTYLNSQTYEASSDRPLMGTGIIGVYDPKNKMSYLTFKFKSYSKEVEEPTSYTQYQVLSKDFTIGFSHVTNKFIGFYDKIPAIWHNHNQSVLSANNPKNLNKYYAPDMVLPTPFSQGDVFAAGDGEFIFLTDETISAYPIVGSLNVQRLNRTNEIYIENEEKTYTTTINGYEYNTLYGKVVDNELETIVTPKAGQISVTNCEMGADGDNFTDITISADNGQTATDSNIASTNRNYKYFDGSWWFNLPLSSLKGRITDKYLKMRIKKKNWSSNPTVNDGKLTIFQFIRAFFENKR